MVIMLVFVIVRLYRSCGDLKHKVTTHFRPHQINYLVVGFLAKFLGAGGGGIFFFYIIKNIYHRRKLTVNRAEGRDFFNLFFNDFISIHTWENNFLKARNV